MGDNCSQSQTTPSNQSDQDSLDASLYDEQPSAFVLATWMLVLFSCMFAALIFVAVVGNAVIIWTVLGRPAMRTVTNYFLLNLAFADFINVTLNVPFVFIYVADGNIWYFGTPYCKIMTFLGNCVLSAIVFTFMAIAIERYMAILFPLRARMSKRVSVAVLLATWIASAIIASPPAAVAVAGDDGNETNDTRTLCAPNWHQLYQHYYDVTLLAVNYGLPLTVLCFAYTRVCVVLWRQDAMLCDTSNKTHQAESIKVKRKVVRMMITLVIVFAVAWIPMHSYFVSTSMGTWLTSTQWAPVIYICAYWLAMSTSAINPCIYFAYSKRFRAGLLQLFRCCPSCREGAERYDATASIAKPKLTHCVSHPLTRKSGTTSATSVRIANNHLAEACLKLVTPVSIEAKFANGNMPASSSAVNQKNY